MDMFSKTSQFPKKHHRCISLETGQTMTKKSYPKTPLDLPRFFPRRYSTPELAMRKHALKHSRDGGDQQQPISNKSCQTDMLGLDKYLQRSPPTPDSASLSTVAALRAYRKPSKKPKVRSVGVHCERRRLTFAAFKGCQKFKHVYKRKISLPQPSSTTTCTSADNGRQDNGMLPKLRLDRTDTVDRPAAAKTGPSVKLPRISTRDATKPETDRSVDGGGGGRGVGGVRGTRLAKLSRPRSTGSGDRSGSSSGNRKLAYFRASSAPKIDSRYYTLIAAPPPPPSWTTTAREQQSVTTAGSSNTADTVLDMSFVRQQHGSDRETSSSSSSSSSVATTTTTAATTVETAGSSTRTVSTSTTFIAEPVFPIVFSCESVLRHPLDGGYVSHTESHRFSVHYEQPVEEDAMAGAYDHGSPRSSSLVFTSAAACQNERCLTGGGDSISVVTVRGGELSSTSASTADTAVERRLVVERLHRDAQSIDAAMDGSEGNVIGRTGGRYVLGKGDDAVVVHGGNVDGMAVPPRTEANKTIDTFGGDRGVVEEKVALESHAHSVVLRSAERNHERLTLQIDSGRTVSNQSPIFDDDCTGTRLLGTDVHGEIDRKPVRENDGHATESGVSPYTEVVSGSPKRYSPTDDAADPAKQSTDTDTDDDHSTKRSVESAVNSHDDSDPTLKSTDDTNRLTADRSVENCSDPVAMASHHGGGGGCKKHGDFGDKRGSGDHGRVASKRNVPKRLHDEVSRKHEEERAAKADRTLLGDVAHTQVKAEGHSNVVHHRRGRGEPIVAENMQHGRRRLTDDSGRTCSRTVSERGANDHHQCGGPFVRRMNESDRDGQVGGGAAIKQDGDSCGPVAFADRRAPNEYGTNDACRRCCTHKSQLRRKNEPPKHYCGVQSGDSGAKMVNAEDREGEHHGHSSHYGNTGKTQLAKPQRRRLESVDECAESKGSNYVGGYLFGDSIYCSSSSSSSSSSSNSSSNSNSNKQPEKRDASTERSTAARPCKYEYCDDPKRVNFSSKADDVYRLYGYYENYGTPKTRHSPGDEDCTVFAECNKGRAAEHASYYSQLGEPSYGGGGGSGGDDKNTDSDESLTDSLEDGKCEGAASVSYFLALNGQRSAVTFTLKMPNTLQSRLNQRRSMLKKHLHGTSTCTARKSSVRVRTRHKSCQTLWTEEKGVQAQRGLTANVAHKSAADDRKVLETLLAGLERQYAVSDNQIRVVAGHKMVSEGNQTDRVAAVSEHPPPTDRHTQTLQAGPGTPPENRDRVQSLATVNKFSADNALMVGVVRQNKYKGKEALDGVKNDQLFTLSKGWINFYTLRADSADTADAAQELIANDDPVKPDDDNQQYTVHVQAIPEPITLPVVHVPTRNTLQVPKTCSTTKHLPRLVQTESNNNHHCSSHSATDNGWCVSVDGPNNMHMKVSLLPEKSDIKTAEHFDYNEENKLEARRLALQRKNNCMRKPYRNIKRTQSTPRDMFSADVSRTESALSAESKYIETIDTQLLIHKARRRLSQEWDTRIQNGGVTESVQLVVTGDSVSSRTSQHYATRGHQHCSFRRQSRRI